MFSLTTSKYSQPPKLLFHVKSFIIDVKGNWLFSKMSYFFHVGFDDWVCDTVLVVKTLQTALEYINSFFFQKMHLILNFWRINLKILFLFYFQGIPSRGGDVSTITIDTNRWHFIGLLNTTVCFLRHLPIKWEKEGI